MLVTFNKRVLLHKSVKHTVNVGSKTYRLLRLWSPEDVPEARLRCSSAGAISFSCALLMGGLHVRALRNEGQ